MTRGGLSMVWVLNVLAIIVGISAVVTYEWIHKTFHWVHIILGILVLAAAGYADALKKYYHQESLNNAWQRRCGLWLSAPNLFPAPKGCRHRPFGLLGPVAPKPQFPSIVEILLDSLKAVPWILLGVVIGFGIKVTWNQVFPRHQIEDREVDPF